MLWSNPFKELTKKEWLLWLISFTVVIGSNFIAGNLSLLQVLAPAVGITAVICMVLLAGKHVRKYN